MASDPDSGSPRGGRRSLNASPINDRPNFSLEDRMNEYLEQSLSSQSRTSTRAEGKFSRYISESLLDDGPPARYQLKVKRLNLNGLSDEESNLRRFTVGNKDPQYQNKTVLLVGATGSGKSTLINALVNFVMGVKFEDKVWFEMVPEEKRKSQVYSQTSVSVYQVFGFEGKTLPYSLTIIDTPGYGDARGTEFDLVIKHLQDLFSIPGGVKSIDAVGLVLKPSENRLDERTAYIFNLVTSLFGRDMEQNIVALMTHSDGRKPTGALRALDEAKVKCARDKKNKPVHFCFNNCQKKKIKDEKDSERALMDFEMSNKGLKGLTEFLGQCHPRSLMKSVEEMGKFHLKACLQNVKERIETIRIKQEVIETNKKTLSNYEKVMRRRNIDFPLIIKEHYREKRTIPGSGFWGRAFRSGATVCNKCKENCHYPGCTIALGPSWCEAMKNGRCTSCTRKCPVEDHVKNNEIYVDETRMVKKTYQEMKARYEENKAPSEEKTSLSEDLLEDLLEDLEKDMAALQQQTKMCLYEAEHHMQQLNPHSVSDYVQLEFMIDQARMSEDVEKLEKMREWMDEMYLV